MTDRWILRAVLARAGFRRLLLTRVAGQFGDGVFEASLASAVLFNPQRQADPASIAAGFAVLLLPYSFVGPFAGVLLDRWSRQRVLVVSNVVRCGLVAGVAAETWTGLAGLPFYASALVVISVNRFFLAALSAALPHVVDEPQLVTANSTSTTCGSLATTLGAAAALSLLPLAPSGNHGYALVALASALGYGGSALAARGFDQALLGPDLAERATRETLAEVARGLVAGGRHVLARRPALYALGVIGGHRFWYGISFVATLLLYRNHFVSDGFFRAGAAGLGQVVVCTALGALLAAAVTPPLARRVGKPAWITGMVATAAVVQGVLGAPYSMLALLPAAVVLGFAAQGAKICVDTTVQESVDDAFRGRVFSLYDTLFNMTFVAAAVFSAFTLPPSGKSYVVLSVVVVGYAVTAALYASATRRMASPVPTPVPTP
ncbi:MAG TPA: MFS transporter [Mycobacteriales bacterium]|nr:MFS transporter [Mycobacteriales bacterium]